MRRKLGRGQLDGVPTQPSIQTQDSTGDNKFTRNATDSYENFYNTSSYRPRVGSSNSRERGPINLMLQGNAFGNEGSMAYDTQSQDSGMQVAYPYPTVNQRSSQAQDRMSGLDRLGSGSKGRKRKQKSLNYNTYQHGNRYGKKAPGQKASDMENL